MYIFCKSNVLYVERELYMSELVYLLNVGISGIKSIKKDVKLEFYKKTINSEFDPDKYRVKAIYGENGAGKSAIITAIKIFQDLIMKDHYLSEFKTQSFLDEIVNKESKKFSFNCEFLADIGGARIVYYYGFVIAPNSEGIYELQSEILKSKNGNYHNNNYKTIFETRQGVLECVDAEGDERENIFLKTFNLLSSNSFIYLYFMSVKSDTTGSMQLFIDMILSLILSTCIKVYLGEEDQHELYFLRKRLNDSSFDDSLLPDNLKDMAESIRGLSSVSNKTVEKKHFEKYSENVARLTEFIKIFKSDLVSIDIDKKENGDNYECELNLNYGEYSINREFESTGIKKLIRLFDCFSAASNGGIVFIDEMDSNLNDVYLCKLIEYFMYYGKGQLCFTTHNLDPMSVLKENKNSIDFLSSDNNLVSWVSRGNAIPENYYRNGMIEDLPFNIDATDFVGIFEE